VIDIDLVEDAPIERVALRRPPSNLVLAVRDLAQGVLRWWLWGLVAWWDIKQRYRGSILGPFWLTLSTAIMIGGLGALYSRLLHTEIRTYLPYLSLGILGWNLISALLNECCTAFISSEHVIKQLRMPLSVHLYRVIARNLIVYAHNMIVFIVVGVLFEVDVTWYDLMVVPGILLLILGMLPAGLLLAALCSRFRDIAPVVASVLQLIFFMTPIMWRPELLGTNIGLALYNPFNCFIDLIRSPLLGEAPSSLSWMMAGGATLALWLVTFPFFARFRARIAYWV
jgi:lipopolysaccharide transport system permease protein